ncbi:MAG: FtsX-like permease family protein [Ignavibacteria bacterium]
MKIIHKSSLRYIFKHKLQFGLSILGIAIGVAIIAAIDIANISTSKAFNMSLNAVTGKATHRIISTSGSIPDSLYNYLRIEKGLKNIAPVVEDNIIVGDSTRKTFVLLGLDLFAEKPFRDYLSESSTELKGGLKDFMVTQNGVVLSEENARVLRKRAGDTIDASVRGKKMKVVVAGLISNYGNPSQLENLIITDIATAQEMTRKFGFIDAIDVITDKEMTEEFVKNLLPQGFELQRSSARSDIAEQMLSAFNVNLNALSMLALIVGVFLIHNTMTFSVVQRKKVLGIYRSLGVTENEIYRLIIGEVFLIGMIGTMLGFLLAIVISKNLLVLISRTINDLYFVVSVTEIEITWFIILKTLVVGIAASIISALKPAREASQSKPGVTMARSGQEVRLVSKVYRFAVYGILWGLAGVLILSLPSRNVWLSYGGVLPIIIGFALLTPLSIKIADKILTPLSGKIFGITGRISSRSIIQNISRTNTAIFSLSIAVAATVGVGTMISSFRSTVVTWLENGLKADLYVSPPTLISNSNEAYIPYYIKDSIMNMAEVKNINYYSEFKLFQDGDVINILASGFTDPNAKDFRLKSEDENVNERFRNGEVLLTEPYAYKNNLSTGDTIKLKTDEGYRNFRVAGIYYDYSSDKGFVSIEYFVFQKYWKSTGLSGMAVFIKDGVDADAVRNRVNSFAGKDVELIIRSNKFLRESSIQIFDRTFIVANVLQLLAVIVAFVGVLSSLMALQLERNKEMGVLRAVGLLPFQLFKISTLQSILMGIISGLLALPLGALLAYILVFIINKRSFGWTMQLSLEVGVLIEALILSVAAAVLAGLYPGFRISKISPSAALREE